jgi:periodic tryptophan protein 1
LQDFATLECHVYDTTTGNLYIHHDIPLPSLPLCLAHGQTLGNSRGNFCAVGTFDPAIEIWNLDVVNALEPSCILGGEDRTTSGKGAPLKPDSHTGAVMGLSWNQVHKHVLASGSADNTVKLWDVSIAGSGSDKSANAGTFKHHKDKVQSVVWHPVEATILATGSYDRTVALLDARDLHRKSIKTVSIPSDCEALAWDPFRPENLTAACENGLVITWDVRKFATKTPLWSFDASEFGVNDISYNR